MFKQMSNREFSDWLADAAWSLDDVDTDHKCTLPPSQGTLVKALREASQRIKSSGEFQLDVREAKSYERTSDERW